MTAPTHAELRRLLAAANDLRAFSDREAELRAIAAKRELAARLPALLDEMATLTAERDAYKRAKEENDDRFMRERDEARAERDALRVAPCSECNIAGPLTYRCVECDAVFCKRCALLHFRDSGSDLAGVMVQRDAAERERGVLQADYAALTSRITDMADNAIGLQVPGTPPIAMLDALEKWGHGERIDASRWESRATAAEAEAGRLRAILGDALDAINQEAWTVLADRIRTALAAGPAVAPTKGGGP